MPRKDEHDDLSIDPNGCLTERVVIGDQALIVHHDELPDADVTTVHGIPCTTALRTVIDIAPELHAAELEQVVRHCLDRGLFSVDEAMARVAERDMLTRPGARLLRRVLSR
jgi:hypothetical protein